MAEAPSSGDPRDYVLDLSSARSVVPAKDDRHAAPAPAASADETTLSILFRCCNAYAQIRLVADGTAYAGHCPRCARAIRVEIDPNSHNSGRFFTAG